MHRRLCVWVVVFGAAGSGFAQNGGEKASSRDLSDMFYANTSTSTVPKKPAPPPRVHHTGAKSDSGAAPATKPVSGPEHIGLKYHILLVDKDCNVSEVPASYTFHSGDKIRLQMQSNVNGYLYVMQKGTSGSESVLFPSPQINGGENKVERGILYSIPSNQWFHFNEVPGEEHLLAIVSRKPLDWLPNQAAPNRSEPQQLEAQNSPVTLLAAVTNLNRNIISRDLVLFDEKAPSVRGVTASAQSTIVVNTSKTDSNTVYVQITLKHQ